METGSRRNKRRLNPRGQAEYTSYLLIDFNRASADVKALFDDLTDLDFIFLQLQTIYRVVLERRRSVIIFDEVQKCPKAREAIKYLVQDGRYDYIETGSLISIRKNTKNITIPSEEERMDMYPMDFEEFRGGPWAIPRQSPLSGPSLKSGCRWVPHTDPCRGTCGCICWWEVCRRPSMNIWRQTISRR